MDTKKLRQKILDLAIRGKLVPQDPNDEPASVLLDRIRAEKERLIAEGKIKRSKKSKTSDASHYQNLPNGWIEVSLGELFEIGSAKRVMKSDWRSEGIPFYRTREIVKLGENGVVDNDLFISLELYNEMKDKYGVPQPNDIMLTAVGTIGIPYIVTESDLFYYKDASVLCLSNICKLNSEFFKYVLLSDTLREQMFSASKGTTVDTITIEKASAYRVLLPSLNEQQRIVIELNKWFNLISNIERGEFELNSYINIAKSKILDLAISGKLVSQNSNDEPAIDALRRLNPCFKPCDNPHYQQLPFDIPNNWCWATLGSIAEYGNCISENVSDIGPNDWVLELEDIEKDTAKVLQHITRKERNISGIRYRFSSGCVLYSKLRTYLNKVLVATESGYCTTEIIPIRCLQVVLPEYLCMVLRSPYFLAYTAQCGYGVKMPRLSTTDANKGLIPLPCLTEQKRIISVVKSLYEILDTIAADL